MAGEPSISVREWIKWIPEPESEPTSTLVLTSSSKQFVDVRILKPTHDGEPELPNQGGPMTRLDWAFAGTSSSHPLPPPHNSSSPTSHSTWTHWIDSLHADVSNVTDQGDMYPHSDGIHCLEKGNMVNPATGEASDYEEFWTEETIELVEGRRWSVVLRMEDEIVGAEGKVVVVRGMVVRVGQWCQGLMRVGDEIALERWKYVGDMQSSGQKGEKGGVLEPGAGDQEVEEKTQEGKWQRVARLGRLFLPCAIAFRPEGIMLGNRVTYGDYKWEVNEVYSW